MFKNLLHSLLKICSPSPKELTNISIVSTEDTLKYYVVNHVKEDTRLEFQAVEGNDVKIKHSLSNRELLKLLTDLQRRIIRKHVRDIINTGDTSVLMKDEIISYIDLLKEECFSSLKVNIVNQTYLFTITLQKNNKYTYLTFRFNPKDKYNCCYYDLPKMTEIKL